MEPKSEEVRVLGENDGAEEVTVTGWRSYGGRFYFKNKDLAQYDGATHRRCACGKLTKKHYTACDPCRFETKRKQWETGESRDWEGTTPVFCLYYDKYFQDMDALQDEIDEGEVKEKDLMLVHCHYNHVPYLGTNFYEDLFDDEGDITLSKELQLAMHNVNKIAHEELAKICYHPTKVRAVYSYSSQVLA